MNEFLLFGYGAFGATLLEMIHWYKRRDVILHSGIDEYSNGFKYYALIVVIFVLGSGMLSVVYFGERDSINAVNVVIFGASVPSFVKIGAKTNDNLGHSRFSKIFDSLRRGYTA